jgi:hypothetical protein
VSEKEGKGLGNPLFLTSPHSSGSLGGPPLPGLVEKSGGFPDPLILMESHRGYSNGGQSE